MIPSFSLIFKSHSFAVSFIRLYFHDLNEWLLLARSLVTRKAPTSKTSRFGHQSNSKGNISRRRSLWSEMTKNRNATLFNLVGCFVFFCRLARESALEERGSVKCAQRAGKRIFQNNIARRHVFSVRFVLFVFFLYIAISKCFARARESNVIVLVLMAIERRAITLLSENDSTKKGP